MNLDSANVLLTGASRGLGRALAHQLAYRGARLVLVARGREPLDALVASLRERGFQAHAMAADVADQQAIYPLVARAQEAVGPIDLLVNNASSLGPLPMPSLLDTECEDLERVLAANLLGPFRLTKALAGGMALRGRGVVVNISSDAATEAYPTWGSYAVSKAALDHLARIWHAELGDTGVRFLAVDPGEMATRMHADAFPDADPSTLAAPEAIARRIVTMILDPACAPGGARLEAATFAEVPA